MRSTLKTILIFLLVALIAYFVNLGMQLAWHYALLEGVTFRIETDWLPWHTLAGMPPVIILYAVVGWTFSRYYPGFKLSEVILFICIVLAWRLFFIKQIWHIDPSIANLTWAIIEFVLPCIAVLVGYQINKLRLNNVSND
jgi:hypothetical protein